MADESTDPAMEKMWAAFDAARFDEAVQHCEGALAAIRPTTPFHAIIGKSFLGQLKEVEDWLTAFYDRVSDEFDVTVIEVQMNRFEINNNAWYIEAMAFDLPAEEVFEDMGMLQSHSERLVFEGVGEIQAAMEEMHGRGGSYDQAPDHLRKACDLTRELVPIHMMNVVSRAHRAASEAGHPIGGIPFFASVHDDPFIYDAQWGSVEQMETPGELAHRLAKPAGDPVAPLPPPPLPDALSQLASAVESKRTAPSPARRRAMLRQTNNPMATTGLVLGIGCWVIPALMLVVPFGRFGLVMEIACCIAGSICSVMGLQRSKTTRSGRSAASAGLILSMTPMLLVLVLAKGWRCAQGL